MATLLELPVEVIHSVAELLSVDDLSSLRQSCQRMNAMTLEIFVRDYFQTRYVMLERQSLETLISISEHATLGPAVRVLGFCTEHLVEMDDEQGRGSFPFLYEAWGFEDEFFDENDDDIGLEEDGTEDSYAGIYRERLDDQEAFLCGSDIIYLTRAMRGLPNCKTLILTDAHVPWGAVRLERAVDNQLGRGFNPNYVEDEQFVKRILHVMLSAAVKSKLPIENLDFYLGHVDEPKSVNPISLQLLGLPYYRKPADWTLTSLTSLRLVVSPSYKDGHAHGWEKRLSRFFELFPQLSHLTLAFDDEFDNHTVFPIFSRLRYRPRLRVVELARLEATAPELVKVLLQHESTLEEITLREVKMYDARSWLSLLGTVRDMPRVRRLTMKNCLIGDSFFTDVSDEMDEIISITDRQGIEKVTAWIEIASVEMIAG